MKRLRRYIFNTLTVVSLLLLLAVAGLWVDSYWYSTFYSRLSTSQKTVLKFSNSPIGIRFSYVDATITLIYPLGWYEMRLDNADMAKMNSLHKRRWFGFDFKFGQPDDGGTIHYSILAIPHWFLTLIFAIIPAIWLFKWNKRRKLGPNACPGCGYDLTGNTTGECPECGADIIAT